MSGRRHHSVDKPTTRSAGSASIDSTPSTSSVEYVDLSSTRAEYSARTKTETNTGTGSTANTAARLRALQQLNSQKSNGEIEIITASSRDNTPILEDDTDPSSRKRKLHTSERDPSLLLTDPSQPVDTNMRNYLNRVERDQHVRTNPSAFETPSDHGRPKPLPPLSLYSRQHIGLLVSVVFASAMTSCLKRGLLPIMKGEFQLSSSQVDAAEVLVMMPWSLTFIIGFISDAFPILGTHRKSYMIIGWTLTAVSLFIMAILNYSQEYDVRLHREDTSRSLQNRIAVINGYLFLFFCAAAGGILAVIMGEIYLIAQSKRERTHYRGQIVGTYILTQFFFECVGQGITDYYLFQITEFGVQPQFSFRQIVLFFALYAVVPVLALVFVFTEQPNAALVDEDNLMAGMSQAPTEYESSLPISGDEAAQGPREGTYFFVAKTRFRAHWRLVWFTLSRLSTWHVVRFVAIIVFFSEFKVKYPHVVLDEICGVSLKVASSGNIVLQCMNFIGVYVWRVFCMNTHWKWFAGTALIAIVWIPQVLFFHLALYDVFRRVDVYVIVTSLQGFVRGLIVVLEIAMAIEIAPDGGEGATVGLIASVAAIMRLLSASFTNAIGFAFNSQLIEDNGIKAVILAKDGSSAGEEVKLESTQDLLIRLGSTVKVALVVCYLIKLVAVASLYFAPIQKRHLQRLHRKGAPSKKYAVWTIAILLVSLVTAMTFNYLVVKPETSCMTVFGGTGCRSATSTDEPATHA
ncbi:hypothetical protein Poli38472_009378 [Pythium oligandrum]|uniref:Transmembrane protein n=1 Tax=Pythium oligandrum TaxID=41045 RepID=A0A8K1CKC5_PYTOL|nr:hypothetical protein Poli38472_009378 [Pythium oligandrum]|eukprot:TMW65211.1 hypothetical protein Poli38472_009378 [Pythium oligandrum]